MGALGRCFIGSNHLGNEEEFINGLDVVMFRRWVLFWGCAGAAGVLRKEPHHIFVNFTLILLPHPFPCLYARSRCF